VDTIKFLLVVCRGVGWKALAVLGKSPAEEESRMAQAPVMPLFTDALIGDTTHLSAEQFGCYVLILISTWRNNGQALPDDDVRMSRVCRITATNWRRKVRPVLCEMFTVSETGWHQQRLEKEWNRVSDWLSQQRSNGRAGGLAKAKRRSSQKLANHKPYKKEPSSSVGEVAARASSPNGGATHAHDTGTWKPIGRTNGASSPPAPSAPTKGDRAAEHWNFLNANGASGEAERYLAAIETGLDYPPDEIFDAVEARMLKGAEA
jgi:uncharacterized protein YdaU (DUF1376 family)